MNDLMFKATDKAAWDAFALASGLALQVDEAVVPAPGILIDEIGPIVITPAVLDEQGEIVTPAVIDEAHHVNVRVMSRSIDLAALAAGGSGVEWIDPAIVTSPERIWAGGMNYFTK